MKRMYVDAVNDDRSWELTILEQHQQMELEWSDSPSRQAFWEE
ncbi:MAG: hypothetical protein ACUVSQ_13110 [Pseudanabaenaceae cyanobacterium]